MLLRISLYLIFICDMAILFYGLYIKSSDIIFGEKLIGISVLVFCFLFMPLFLYYRYRNKKLDDYLYKD